MPPDLHATPPDLHAMPPDDHVISRDDQVTPFDDHAIGPNQHVTTLECHGERLQRKPQSRRTGDLDRRGKVDLARSEIAGLRAQDLVNQATAIRDLAATAVGEPGAENRSVTTEHVKEQSRAIAAFAAASGAPRGQIANGGTVLRELQTDVAALMDKLRDLDDLILQFDRTATGRRFIEAWRRARIIVDVGGSAAAPTSPESPPAAAQSSLAVAARPKPVAQV